MLDNNKEGDSNSYKFNIKNEEGKLPSKKDNYLKTKSISCDKFIKNKGIITDNEYEVTSEYEKER